MDYKIGSNETYRSVDQLGNISFNNGDKILCAAGETSLCKQGLDIKKDNITIETFGVGDRHTIESQFSNSYSVVFNVQEWAENIRIRRFYFKTGTRTAILCQGKNVLVQKCDQRNQGSLIKLRDCSNLKVDDCQGLNQKKNFIYSGGKNINTGVTLNKLRVIMNKNNGFHNIRLHKCKDVQITNCYLENYADYGGATLNLRDGENFTLKDITCRGNFVIFGPLADENGDDEAGWENFRLKNVLLDGFNFKDTRGILESGLVNFVFQNGIWRTTNNSGCIGVESWYGPRPPASGHITKVKFYDSKILTGTSGHNITMDMVYLNDVKVT